MRSRDGVSGGEQFSAQVGVEQALTGTLGVEVSVRHSRGNGIDDTLTVPSESSSQQRQLE